jgi:heme-degrading monooxygenase HmoA
MILEAAVLSVRPARKSDFEAAFVQARAIISAMPGFLSYQLQRGIDTDGRYLLLVQWRTVEDHTVGFRQSPQFLRWRELIGPFFAAPTAVEHYELVSAGEPVSAGQAT